MTKSKELSIYVHIPFCVKKCLYCDFISAKASEKTKEEYVKTLISEMEKEAFAYQDYTVKTVFFGGGTPSVLSWQQTERIFECLSTNYPMAPQNVMETSIEVNPGTADFQKLEAYRRMGFNRLSIGLQSTKDEELRTLGRIHTYEEFLQTYQAARETGFENINIDLMSALPGQTIPSWQSSLEKAALLHPEHISAYSLMIEEETPFYQIYGSEENRKTAEKPLPSEEEERRMYEMTKEILHQYGYERYEISNYAKKGYECKHNNVYWQRGNYLGFGSAAASMVENVRWSNCGEAKHMLSRQEQMEEFMFLGMRRMEGVDKQDFLEYFEEPMEPFFGKSVQKMQQAGLVTETKTKIYLTEKGIDVSNYVFSEFLLDS